MDDIKLPPLPAIDDYLPTDGPRWTTANFIACVERYATDYARASLAAAPAPAPLTDAEILNCFDAAVPNYVDVSDAEMIDFARAIERALGIGTDAAPAPHPDTADAERWRHVWQCVRMAQHGEYVLLPDEPTGLPDDSIVRARFLQEVDAAIDAARAQAQRSKP